MPSWGDRLGRREERSNTWRAWFLYGGCGGGLLGAVAWWSLDDLGYAIVLMVTAAVVGINRCLETRGKVGERIAAGVYGVVLGCALLMSLLDGLSDPVLRQFLGIDTQPEAVRGMVAAFRSR